LQILALCTVSPTFRCLRPFGELRLELND
jgi:hypothetical protein